MILNEAAIHAGSARKQTVEMADMVKAVLRMQYRAPDHFSTLPDEELRRRALHEAGHLVISEVLDEGSVGLASLRSDGRPAKGGFIHRCRDVRRRPHIILIALGGKAAVELHYADTVDSGCSQDLDKAFTVLREGITENATLGLEMLHVSTYYSNDPSASLNVRAEAVVHAELERYLLKARDILLKNREFLEKTAEELMEKKTLLYSDIQRIRNSVTVTSVEI